MNNQIKTWIELNSEALNHNVKQFQQWLVAPTNIAGVMKANAYGHGQREIALLYENNALVKSICTINLSEAVDARKNGFTKPILIFGYLDGDVEDVVAYKVEVALYDLEIAKKLNAIGEKFKTTIIVQIKVDTGMSRLGLMPDEVDLFVKKITAYKNISIKGIFSHLSQADDKKTTHNQERLFQKFCNKNSITHIASSHAAITTKYKNYNQARIGIGLYGYLPYHHQKIQKMLKPVLSLKAKIVQIKRIKAGDRISYNGTFQAKTNMKIATISIGYAEGVDTRLSNKFFVIINQKKAPIVGTVCMNLTSVDISNIENCKIDQDVTVIGKERNLEVTLSDWSSITKTSVYEHLTRLGSFLPRIITNKK